MPIPHLPEDLRAALNGDDAARTIFVGLPESHQTEFVMWVEESRRPETREQRIAKTLDMLKRG